MSDFKCDMCGCYMGPGDFQSVPIKYKYFKDEKGDWYVSDIDWYCKKCIVLKMRKFKLRELNEGLHMQE